MLDDLIEQITASGGGDDEKMRAWHRAFEQHVVVPCDGFVIGEPISVVEFSYDGHVRRGLTATCRRQDFTTHVVAASDVVLSPRNDGGHILDAYRRWLEIEPDLPKRAEGIRPRRQHKATVIDVDLEADIELVVLSIKEKAARCQLVGTDRAITLRATRLWDVVPGEIVIVKPRRHWSYAGHPYLSGDIMSTRLEIAALGLVPLRLDNRGVWDPREHYWGEADDPIEEWTQPIIACGPRPAFEMEQVLPGTDPEDPDSDPIIQSNDLKNAGNARDALRILMALCQVELRCLDAHAHLGNFEFDHHPALAIRHYEAGLRIGELSLPEAFDGLLPWGHLDNRPFLRCLHGFGLCCWRLGRFEEAERVFERMLWLNPSDNQGVRFEIDLVRARIPWNERPAET